MRARPIFLPKLGAHLRTLREDRGWNQLQAVDMAHRRRLTVSYNTLRWIEDGKIKNPEPETLKALSALYGVGYEELVASYAEEKFGFQPRSKSAPPEAARLFTSLLLLATPISRERALDIQPHDDGDSSLVLRSDFVKRFTRPVALRVGPTESSMKPTIEPGDVVLIDQHLTRRRRPPAGRIFAINEGPLTGTEGGSLARVDLSGDTLILGADNPDKTTYPTRTFEIKPTTLSDVLVGQVVWVARSLTLGQSE